MSGFNKVILLGNLGADPELRMTNGGSAVLKLRLATSETYLDRNKERQERTEWHRVIIWGKRAEGLGKILNKGDRLLVEGSLRTSSYEDKDGNKRYTTEVVAMNVVLSGSSRGGGGGGRGSGGGSGQDHESKGSANGYDEESYGSLPDDDDIPF